MLSFFDWKQRQLKKGLVKPKEWFYSRYGRYCQQWRKKEQ